MRHALTEAMGRMGNELDWYRGLSAADRDLLTLVIETAAQDFLRWMRAAPAGSAGFESPRSSAERIFSVAPAEFTETISLTQALEVTRLIVNVLERNVSAFAEPGRERQTRDAMLRYAREVAFSAASVYAAAAEARGDWDTRLETLVIEDLAEGVADDRLTAHLGMLGWRGNFRCFAIAGGPANPGNAGMAVARRRIRRILHAKGAECLVSGRGSLLVAVIDPRHTETPAELCRILLRQFDRGPVSVGPVRSRAVGASQTVRAALSARAVAPAFAGLRGIGGVPRPLPADDVLPERALLGDVPAREELYSTIYAGLRGKDPGNPLFRTVRTFLLSGRSLETSARLLNVHPNTVRYRLKRSAELTGWDPTDTREAYVLLTAIKIGLIRDARRAQAEGSGEFRDVERNARTHR